MTGACIRETALRVSCTQIFVVMYLSDNIILLTTISVIYQRGRQMCLPPRATAKTSTSLYIVEADISSKSKASLIDNVSRYLGVSLRLIWGY